jgi:hypothetical protein
MRKYTSSVKHSKILRSRDGKVNSVSDFNENFFEKMDRNEYKPSEIF